MIPRNSESQQRKSCFHRGALGAALKEKLLFGSHVATSQIGLQTGSALFPDLLTASNVGGGWTQPRRWISLGCLLERRHPPLNSINSSALQDLPAGPPGKQTQILMADPHPREEGDRWGSRAADNVIEAVNKRTRREGRYFKDGEGICRGSAFAGKNKFILGSN